MALMNYITAEALVPEPSTVEGDMAIGIAEIPAVLFRLVRKTVCSEIRTRKLGIRRSLLLYLFIRWLARL